MGQMLRVLIVEDEILLAMDLEALIEDNGHVVVGEATSLFDVEKLDDNIAPQLALVDIQLARNTNGLDACALIRRRWPEALVVFVTANLSKIPEDFCGAHGAVGKPFSHTGLASALSYLAEGVFNPPPGTPKPASLVASPHLEPRLTHA
ncbi:response regulator [Pacificimonas sp. ICDLI1SI03]|jgi:CheY-like chemotaxis protein|tara:strand:+ start:30469 stop:30915 length:447 start_codon:yes stop_codon:yes gene_type:complete